jgi:hypothetical protein
MNVLIKDILLAYDFNLSMGKDRVNKEKTIVNFSCKEFDSI